MECQSSIRQEGLDPLVLRRLGELKNSSKNEIIPFPKTFQKLCSAFSINKQDCWQLLYYLQDRDLVKIVAFHGIKIKFLK